MNRGLFERLVWVGLIVLAFGGGYYLATPSPEIGALLTAENDGLIEQNQRLMDRNASLEETLDLVKRQVQTDRIAYAALQEDVDDAERKRQELLQKFESQRELLDRLKQKLE